ncbi:MAG: hypothetical protein ACYTF9_15805 [Planctomycetota bacterium]|jgi:hypothetical protein
MAIATRLAPMYAVRTLVTGVACIVFGIWGAYDLFVKIPAEQAASDRYDELMTIKDDIEARAARDEVLTEAERQQFSDVEAELAAIGDAPSPPSTFDRAIQWAFILCLPCAPFFILAWSKAKKKHFELDDAGTLSAPEGRFPPEEIADIDMDRWMAKSVAFVVLQSGDRIKLDDYIYRNTHQIVGSIAARIRPTEWTDEARPVKAADMADGHADAEVGTAVAAGDETEERSDGSPT